MAAATEEATEARHATEAKDNSRTATEDIGDTAVTGTRVPTTEGSGSRY